MFNWTPSRLHWETLSDTAINAQRLFIHTYPPPSIAIRITDWAIEQRRLNEFAHGSKERHRIRTQVLSFESPMLHRPSAVYTIIHILHCCHIFDRITFHFGWMELLCMSYLCPRIWTHGMSVFVLCDRLLTQLLVCITFIQHCFHCVSTCTTAITSEHNQHRHL